MDNGSNVIGNVYRILIVDDNKHIIKSLELSLKFTEFSFACEIYVADNGIKALKLIERERIHLVFTDYEMPNMNGYNLMRAIKEFNESIRVVLISGFPRENVRDEFDGCIEKGFRDFYKLIIDEVNKQAADYFAEKVESIL